MGSVKRVLLGSAAGMFAVAGAQAADLPVKAKPVEYVKVCSLYGAGFWYVPGTDTCIKVGAFVRLDANYKADGGGSFLGGAIGNGQVVNFGGAQTRVVGDFNFRNRNAISFDMRTQTEYGTLRSYIDVGSTISTNGGSVSGAGTMTPLGNAPNFGTSALFVDRAFLQFAGFTAGRMRSFFDSVHIGTINLAQARTSGDSGPNGIVGIAYTWQFGGGLSASLSLEDGGWGTGGRGRSTVNLAGGLAPAGLSDVTDAFGLGTMFPNNKGQQMFDVVGNVRLDQAWGYVHAAAALHDASGSYYGCQPNSAGCVTPYSQDSGHPADKFGWAATLGVTLVNPFGLQGDSVGAMGVYSVGAVGYNTSSWGPSVLFGSGRNVGLSYLVDGIYNNGTAVELNSTWSFQAYYEHLWNNKWRTSLYGGMVGTTFDGAAKAQICPGGAGGTPSPVGFSFGAQSAFTGGVTNCNPDSSVSQMGSRTLWNPVPDVDVAFDVSWVHMNTAFAGQGNLNAMGTVFQPFATGRPGGPYSISNQDTVSAYFRIQRNFLY